MTPGKTFNLSKRSKTIICSIVDPEMRNSFKKMMIQAELAAAVVQKNTNFDKNGSRGNSGYNGGTAPASM